jgi:hypothetical protein
MGRNAVYKELFCPVRDEMVGRPIFLPIFCADGTEEYLEASFSIKS